MRFCAAAGHRRHVRGCPASAIPARGERAALAQSAAALATLLPIARQAGVTLTIEPHVDSYLESPALALELLARVPGLKLTLDYAHFVCLGHTQEASTRWRRTPRMCMCARRGRARCKPSSRRARSTWKRCGDAARCRLCGWLSVEFAHQDYMDTLDHDDADYEMIDWWRTVRRAWLGRAVAAAAPAARSRRRRRERGMTRKLNFSMPILRLDDGGGGRRLRRCTRRSNCSAAPPRNGKHSACIPAPQHAAGARPYRPRHIRRPGSVAAARAAGFPGAAAGARLPGNTIRARCRCRPRSAASRTRGAVGS